MSDIPETQRQAYAAIIASGYLSQTQQLVYEYITFHPGCTRDEIDRALGNGKPNPTASRRLADLERAGLIHRLGVKEGQARWYATSKSTVTKEELHAKPTKGAWAKLARIREIADEPGALFADPRIERIKSVLREAR